MAQDDFRAMDVKLEASSSAFATDDDRWLVQVRQLLSDLKNAGPVRTEAQARPGEKGGIEAIILALGSAGAITAAVEAFKAWLGRDRTRSLKLTIGDVVLEGQDIEVDVINKVVRAARRPPKRGRSAAP